MSVSKGKLLRENNKWGSIIKDDNFLITCADRANWMADQTSSCSAKQNELLGFT